MKKPLIAIVGRPNVGKSALLNRLIQKREAIVEETSGVTRDRIYRDTSWNGVDFTLVDTGGVLLQDPDNLRKMIWLQVQVAIDEADLILFVVDVRDGVHPLDHDVADMLRRSQKQVIVVANKADNEKFIQDAYEFYKLGMGEPQAVSAIHGLGTGDLLDRVVEKLPPVEEAEQEEEPIKISIVGRPNVGKSSLLNSILGEKRSIVTQKPGTTRDAVDANFTWNNHRFVIVDTAGIRRKGKVRGRIEYYSTLRAEKAIRRSAVGLLIVDATEPAVSQDRRLGGILDEWGKGVLIVVNKWDLVSDSFSGRDSRKKQDDFIKGIRENLDFLSYAPVIFTSATENWGINKILPAVMKVYLNCIKRIDTPVLNRIFQDAFYFRPPPSYKGKNLKLYYAHQTGICPPTFVLKVNSPRLIHFSYHRYLENQLRRVVSFEGTPVKLQFRR